MTDTSPHPTPTIRSLDDISRRKAQLRQQIDSEQRRIGELWNALITNGDKATDGKAADGKAATRKPTVGQRIGTFVDYGVVFADAFILVRKLIRYYSAFSRAFRHKKQ